MITRWQSTVRPATLAATSPAWRPVAVTPGALARIPVRPNRRIWGRAVPFLGRAAVALAGVVTATYILAGSHAAPPTVPVTDASWQAGMNPTLPGGPAPVAASAVSPEALQAALRSAVSTGTATAAATGTAGTGTATSSPPRPTWWTPTIAAAAQRSGLPAALLAAVVQVESEGNPRAVSPAGAKGLMQLLPATAAALGVQNIFDPLDNATGGAKYLGQWLLEYAHGDTACVSAPETCPQALELALAAYNAGPNAVRRYGGVPPYAETHRYIQEVLALYAQYRAEE